MEEYEAINGNANKERSQYITKFQSYSSLHPHISVFHMQKVTLAFTFLDCL